MEYGLIAEKLSHSFSKEIHNRIADYTYELKEISKGELEDFLTKREFKAINVTIPYKSSVIPYLDFIDDIAKQIGAVNTVVNKNGKLYGFNTDFFGLKALIEKNNVQIKNKKVLVLGSGGTSKTANAVAKSLGADSVYTVSRKESDGCITYEDVYSEHTDAQIIINTTPCGMFPNIKELAIDIEKLSGLEAVIDVVYNPLCSELVVKAKEKGIKAVGGLYMLVAQAVFACEKFLDKTFDNSVIDTVYSEILSQKQNIVLIGMASCGKSTVGKQLSELLHRPFYDTDVLIEEKTGYHPSVIITQQGEEVFRSIESDTIEEISAVSGTVIATGGGAVIKKINRENLSKNGVAFFLDRPFEKLIATPDRPLSSDREALKKRYKDRYPIYTSFADFTISGEKSVEEICDIIKKEMKL
ncbi:MAG: shikimate kinase [Acutalibacteraceae bacterium]|nr:shikimate kinase [Acutalibacteraceae bacterium]